MTIGSTYLIGRRLSYGPLYHRHLPKPLLLHIIINPKPQIQNKPYYKIVGLVEIPLIQSLPSFHSKTEISTIQAPNNVEFNTLEESPIHTSAEW